MCINAAIFIFTPITDIDNKNLAEEGQCQVLLPEPMLAYIDKRVIPQSSRPTALGLFRHTQGPFFQV